MKIISEGRRPVPPGKFGLGDAVGAVATPIARVLRLPCVDPATKQLRPESPCSKRKADLNAFGRRVGEKIRGAFGAGGHPPQG